MKTFKLIKAQTNTKAAKYLYKVIDESGNVLITRKSNRDYVACTIDGEYFFGRLDLIGKGDHGRELNVNKNIINGKIKKENFNGYEVDWEKVLDNCKKKINKLNQIAYL